MNKIIDIIVIEISLRVSILILSSILTTIKTILSKILGEKSKLLLITIRLINCSIPTLVFMLIANLYRIDTTVRVASLIALNMWFMVRIQLIRPIYTDIIILPQRYSFNYVSILGILH